MSGGFIPLGLGLLAQHGLGSIMWLLITAPLALSIGLWKLENLCRNPPRNSIFVELVEKNI
jgi:hypothetical protein